MFFIFLGCSHSKTHPLILSLLRFSQWNTIKWFFFKYWIFLYIHIILLLYYSNSFFPHVFLTVKFSDNNSFIYNIISLITCRFFIILFKFFYHQKMRVFNLVSIFFVFFFLLKVFNLNATKISNLWFSPIFPLPHGGFVVLFFVFWLVIFIY